MNSPWTAATTAIAVAVGVVTACATSGAAAADDGNAAFLNALTNSGVQYTDPAATTALGQAVCPLLAKPGGTFAEALSTVNGGGVPPAMAGLFTTIAISMYCPSMISSLANGDLAAIPQIPGLSGTQIPGLPGF